MRSLLVSDLMTEKVFTLQSKDNLTALYDLMDAEHIRHIPVLDSEGDVVGLVTHRDLLRTALGRRADLPLSRQREILSRRAIEEIMTRDIETIAADATIGEAAEIMLENKYGCLPVVEGNRLVGILTEADFVRCLAGYIPGVRVEHPSRARAGRQVASRPGRRSAGKLGKPASHAVRPVPFPVPPEA